MKIYLCGRYSRREHLKFLRTELERLGHTITSRWLDTEWNEKDDTGGSSHAPPAYRQEYAIKDAEDVCEADTLVALTEEPRSGGRGGRHVGFGMALALKKRLIVVGYHENVFHHHPLVEFYPNHWNMLRALEMEANVSG